MQFRNLLVAFATLLLVLLGGCASAKSTSPGETMTAENIRDEVSTALRDAGTFRFEMTAPDPANEDADIETTGEIAYTDDGDVDALAFTQPTDEYRFVDDVLYHRAGEDDEFQELDDNATDDFLTGWDWAAAVEEFPAVEELSEEGSDEIDGVETTKYEVTFPDRTETWWLDDDRRLIKQSTDDTESRLSGFGEPVDITAP